MKFRYKVLCISCVAFLHYQAYKAAWIWAFALGENREEVPPLLAGFVYVLGAPIMYLVPMIPDYFGPDHRWWGDYSNLLIGGSMLNALLWASAITWLFDRFQRRYKKDQEKKSNQALETTRGK